jgi:hypothetical protein
MIEGRETDMLESVRRNRKRTVVQGVQRRGKNMIKRRKMCQRKEDA